MGFLSDPDNRRSAALLGVLLLIAVGAFAVGTRAFMKSFRAVPPLVSQCWDSRGWHAANARGSTVSADFADCRIEAANTFYKVDFAESKDLAKAFLTLLTAVLVASITFSEKIVDLTRAGWTQRGLMILCWVLLLAAILLCGVGLAYMTEAAAYATHFPNRDFGAFENRAFHLFVLAGLSFAGGLAALLVAGIFSLAHRKAPDSAAS